jgi:hypothetical protein
MAPLERQVAPRVVIRVRRDLLCAGDLVALAVRVSAERLVVPVWMGLQTRALPVLVELYLRFVL